MKHIIQSLIILSFAFVMSCKNEESETIQSTAVPDLVHNSFMAKYPGATDIKWEKENEDNIVVYEAEFKHNDVELEAKYDANGNFLSDKKD